MDIVLLSPPLYQEWICRCMAGAKSRRIMIFWFNMDREIIAAVSENFPHPPRKEQKKGRDDVSHRMP